VHTPQRHDAGGIVETRDGLYLRQPRDAPLALRVIPRAFAARTPAPAPAAGGLCFEASRPPPAGAMVELCACIAGETLRFRGTVRWVRPLGRRFEVGVRLASAGDARRARAAQQAGHIEAYRRRESRRTGRSVGIEQAARTWIVLHASRFAERWARILPPEQPRERA